MSTQNQTLQKSEISQLKSSAPENQEGRSLSPPQFGVETQTVQQKEKEKNEESAQLKADSTEEKSMASPPFAPSDGAGGNPNGLPDPVQAKMEQSFGADFSDVNVHENSNSASQMGALAYTQGNNVHFAPGQFKPDSQSGQELIGHELTHVVQQRSANIPSTTQKGGFGINDDAGLEKEADEKGAKAAAGKSVGGLAASGSPNGGAIQAKKADPNSSWSPTEFSNSYEENVDKSGLTSDESAFFKEYAEKADTYLARYNNWSSANGSKRATDMSGQMMADAAIRAYLRYDKDITKVVPLEMALAQGQFETKFNAAPRESSTTDNNPYNVGEYDSSTAKWLDGLDDTEKGVSMYYDLMAEDYLSKRTPDELLKNYVNENDKRYASATHYETKLTDQIAYIKKKIGAWKSPMGQISFGGGGGGGTTTGNSTPAKAKEKTSGGSKRGSITASSLNVRTGPGKNNGKVGDPLKKGATVTILEEKNGWYRIGEGRWVSGDYVKVSGGKKTSGTKTTPGGKNEPDYQTLAQNVWDAMFGGITGWGTEEDKVYNNLAKLNKDSELIRKFKKVYSIKFGTNVVSDIKSEFSNNLLGNELDKALSYLKVSGGGKSSGTKEKKTEETDTGTPGERKDDSLERFEFTSNAESRAHSRWNVKGKGSKYVDKFNETIDTQIAAFFGEGYTRDRVMKEISEAQAKGDVKKAEEMRVKLFKANLYNVVDTLDVENESRYKAGGGKTYCNIYAYDVVSAMGGFLPRLWWTKSVEDKMISGDLTKDSIEPTTGKAYKNLYGDPFVLEQNANQLTAWMDRVGQHHFGWEKATDMKGAQEAANGGNLVIILAANKNSGKSGHVNVILPETEQNKGKEEDGKYLPVQSQAGGKNFKASNYKSWWNNSSHKDGAAWIARGTMDSVFMTPTQLGGASSGGAENAENDNSAKPKAKTSAAKPPVKKSNPKPEVTPVANTSGAVKGAGAKAGRKLNKKGVVTATGLNVRAGIGTSAKILKSLKQGEEVTIFEEKSGWYRIGTNSWVSGKHIKVSTGAPAKKTNEPKYDSIASKVNYAMHGGTGWGTDEKTVYLQLAKLKKNDEFIAGFQEVYQKKYGVDIETDIRSEFSNNIMGRELDMALYLLNISPGSGGKTGGEKEGGSKESGPEAKGLKTLIDKDSSKFTENDKGGKGKIRAITKYAREQLKEYPPKVKAFKNQATPSADEKVRILGQLAVEAAKMEYYMGSVFYEGGKWERKVNEDESFSKKNNSGEFVDHYTAGSSYDGKAAPSYWCTKFAAYAKSAVLGLRANHKYEGEKRRGVWGGSQLSNGHENFWDYDEKQGGKFVGAQKLGDSNPWATLKTQVAAASGKAAKVKLVEAFFSTNFQPQPGDIMITTNKSNNSFKASKAAKFDSSHTTTIEKVEKTGDSIFIHTIEGNSGDMVTGRKYDLTTTSGSFSLGAIVNVSRMSLANYGKSMAIGEQKDIKDIGKTNYDETALMKPILDMNQLLKDYAEAEGVIKDTGANASVYDSVKTAGNDSNS